MSSKRKAAPSPASPAGPAKRFTRSSVKSAIESPSTPTTQLEKQTVKKAKTTSPIKTSTARGIGPSKFTPRRSPRFGVPSQLSSDPLIAPPGAPPAPQLAKKVMCWSQPPEDVLFESIWTEGGMAAVRDKDVLLTHVVIEPATTTNYFYRMQLLQTGPGSWKLYSRWGRVGQSGEWKLDGPWKSLELAEDEFCQRFKAKTKNDWTDRHKFELKPGAFGLVELDAGFLANSQPATSAFGDAMGPSQTEFPAQQGVRVIFAANSHARASLHPKHMPLGTLSVRQIQRGMAVLDALRGCHDGRNDSTSRLQSLSAQFYQLIPHASPLTVLSTPEQLQEKHEMLSSLLCIVAGLNVESAVRTTYILNVTRSSLHCDLNVVPSTDPMHPVLLKCIANTQVAIPGATYKVVDIWAIRRHPEDLSFPEFATSPIHQLLWHGTKMHVLPCILKAGLRIMPRCSMTYGRGIYLTNMLEKAKHHARIVQVGDRSMCCVFLAEAALGNVCQIERLPVVMRNKLPCGFDSVVVKGSRSPQEDQFVRLDGVDVRVEVGAPAAVASHPHSYDEFVVFQERRVRLRYVVMFEITQNS